MEERMIKEGLVEQAICRVARIEREESGRVQRRPRAQVTNIRLTTFFYHAYRIPLPSCSFLPITFDISFCCCAEDLHLPFESIR